LIIDPRLVDLLEDFGAAPWNGDVWRHVIGDRDPLAPSHAGGRWAPPDTFPVLYTSLAREGALAEAAHLISLYSIPPSARRTVCRIDVTLTRVADLTDPKRLAKLGVDPADAGPGYGTCPEIGAAASFLAYQAILVPSLRYRGSNLVVFTERLEPGCVMDVASREAIPSRGI
jgi:RES domain-containing protein